MSAMRVFKSRASRARSKTMIASGLALLVLVLACWALFDASTKAGQAQRLAQHGELALRRIIGMQASLARAESGHRGFLLSGDDAYRRASREALGELEREADWLDGDVAASERTRANNERLDALTRRYGALMEVGERTYAERGTTAAQRAAASAGTERTANQIRAIIDQQAGEQARLVAHQRESDGRERVVMQFILGLGALVMVGLMLPMLWGLARQSRGRHRAEHRLRTMADSLPGTLFVLRRTPKGDIGFDFLSGNAGKIIGVDREKLLSASEAMHQMVVAEDRGRLQEAIARSAEELSELEVDFRVRRPDESIHWIRSSGTPLLLANGDVVWNGYWSDITPMKQAKQALRDALLRLDDAHTVAGLGDWTCDLATGALTWSSQIYQMLGRDPALGPPDLSEGANLFEDGASATAEAFFKAQETGERQSYELTARLGTGGTVTVQVIVVPNVDETGAVVGMRGTIQDISSRKALEERLYQAKEAADSANLAKSDFLATMSHEIRTPLTGMLGILELIAQSPITPELRSALGTVSESGNSLQRIVDDILDFSKMEAGKLEIRPEPTSLTQLAAVVQRAYAGNASSHGLELRHHVDPRISPAVVVDALRLRQILGNFVSNAIKFTPQGSVELVIGLVRREGLREHLCFEVRDTGIGISPERQERLFQPFEQADVDLASRVSGTGLGLAISRRLARLMGGEVSMTSEPGKGTTLFLALTVLPADPAQVAQSPSAGVGIAGIDPEQNSGMSFADVDATPREQACDGSLVLVVDDHPVNRMVMSKQLQTLGYATEEAESGADALEQWASGRYALVLTDCNMPRMSGYELTRLIREREGAGDRPRTPIIACSANVIRGAREACLDAGMDDYIAKPTKLMSLADIMHRWLPLPSRSTGAPPLPDQMEPRHPASANTALDTRILHALSNGDPAVERRALAQFRRINDADSGLLIDAVERGDLDAIVHFAHRIKGACRFIGATELASVSGELEHRARTGDTGGLTELSTEFRTSLESLNAHLDAR